MTLTHTKRSRAPGLTATAAKAAAELDQRRTDIRAFLEEEIAKSAAASAPCNLLDQQLAAVVDLLAGAKPSIISLLRDGNGGSAEAGRSGWDAQGMRRGEEGEGGGGEGAVNGHAVSCENIARYSCESVVSCLVAFCLRV